MTSASSLTERFMQALQTAEQQRDASALVELYAPQSTTQNLTTQVHEGQEGAREFWTTYLETFDSVRSEFTRHASTEDTGVMEWTASGKLKDGRDITYRGVSIIETDGEKVSAFRTYYDSAAFLAPA